MNDFGYRIVAGLVVLLIAMPIHECAHGLVSYWLGDPTAKAQGRLTLNPLKHLDPVGSVMILLAGFGWAKPVPVDPRYYKNRKAGMALTALAGPMSNLILAYIAYAIYKILFISGIKNGWNFTGGAFSFLMLVINYVIVINVTLAVFNLLPIPPLDGSRIFLFFLPEKLYFSAMKYERYIFLGLVALLFLGVLDTPLAWLRNGVFRALDWATGYIDLLVFR